MPTLRRERRGGFRLGNGLGAAAVHLGKFFSAFIAEITGWVGASIAQKRRFGRGPAQSANRCCAEPGPQGFRLAVRPVPHPRKTPAFKRCFDGALSGAHSGSRKAAPRLKKSRGHWGGANPAVHRVGLAHGAQVAHQVPNVGIFNGQRHGIATGRASPARCNSPPMSRSFRPMGAMRGDRPPVIALRLCPDRRAVRAGFAHQNPDAEEQPVRLGSARRD